MKEAMAIFAAATIGAVGGMVLGVVLAVGGTGKQQTIKMEHAMVAAYVCSKVESDTKEFIAVPSKGGYAVTTWCTNGVTITVEIPEAKPVTKDVL